MNTLILILLVLWLLGAFGGKFSSSFPKTGNWIHVLLVIVVVLFVVNQL